MRSIPARRVAPFLLSTVLCTVLVTGCGQPVREDRMIPWSADGSAVGFQHGSDGVFIHGNDGKLRKIFELGAEVLATSTPLWSPDEHRVIFTTAEPCAAGRVPQPPQEPDPAGQLHIQQPVTYTCWLWSEKGGPEARAERLFTAHCNHVGYVAANLAVRWHPQEDQIIYLDEAPGGGHTLFAFDLEKRTARRIFPQAAEALVFDWSPRRGHLACVLGNPAPDPGRDGIWVGQADGGSWWHVPNSETPTESRLSSLLERLRATAPVWTPDGKRFAFVSSLCGPSPNEGGGSLLQLVTLATRRVETLADGPAAFRDLHWTPDGDRLGVVCDGKERCLRVIRPGDGISAPLNRQPVRRFAGWDATGAHLAYVSPEPLPPHAGEKWALLFLAERQPRDRLIQTDGAGKGAGQTVFSGMRITFPTWSPHASKLSAWFTFSPTYRSVLGWLLSTSGPVGLRKGDPAVVLDARTGGVTWLAVNPREKVQVGHYHLLRHDYPRAWEWYEAARQDPAVAKPHDPVRALEEVLGPQDPGVFEYYCLTKLGRTEEARARLARFRDDFDSRLAASRQVPTLAQRFPELADPGSPLALMLRDFYIAEVFLSLNAPADGEQFFQAAVTQARDDRERLSAAVVLAQLLLLEAKYPAYAGLVTDTLLPSLLKVWAAPRPAGTRAPALSQSALVHVAGLTLLPLYTAEFLGGLPKEKVRALRPRWLTLRSGVSENAPRLAVDLFLAASAERLGQQAEARQARRQVEENPVRAELIPGGPEDVLRQVRETRTQLETVRDWLAPQE